jgi:hypothetical protein
MFGKLKAVTDRHTYCASQFFAVTVCHKYCGFSISAFFAVTVCHAYCETRLARSAAAPPHSLRGLP